jgi:hypothetical protein
MAPSKGQVRQATAVAAHRQLYEHHTHRLLPQRQFVYRALRHFGVGSALVFGAVATGTLGYHVIAHLAWIDAVLNASMILTGMGPVDRMETDAAKLFAAAYALFSGLVFVAVVGVIVAPWVHRLLHIIHLDENRDT